MTCKNNQAFTLVELIVVITILAVLGTLWMLSFWSYISNSRDASRISNLRTLEKQLNLQFATTNLYVKPDTSVEVRADTSVIRYQWELWTNALEQLWMSDIDSWKDPLNSSFYTYTVSSNYKQYQLAAFLESTASYFPWVYPTYAWYYSDSTITTIGKPLWIILDNWVPVNEVENIVSLWYLDVKNTSSQYTAQFTNDTSASWTWSTLAFNIAMNDKTVSSIDASLLWFYDMSTHATSWVMYMTDLSSYENHAVPWWSITYKTGYVVDTSPYSTGFRTAYIDTPISIEPSVWNYTFSAWIQTTQSIWSVPFSSIWNHKLLAAKNSTNFDYSPWKAGTSNYNVSFTSGSWVHYVLTLKNDGTTNLYLNWISWTSVDIGTFATGTYLLRAMNYTGNCYMCGTHGSVEAIDDIRIYNRELSTEEIATLHQKGRN